MLQQIWQDLWISILVLLIIIGIFSGQGLVIGFGAMGLVIAGLSWVWNKLSLEDVTYERKLSQQRIFMGEEVTLTITLTNKKPVPLARIQMNDEMPEEIKLKDAELAVSSNIHTQVLHHSTSMAWYERMHWSYTLTATERGFYRIGPVRLESGDLFGFYHSVKSIFQTDYLLVYPRVVSLPDLGLPAARPLGETGGGIRIFEDASRPSGIRDYQTGDPLKIVDWKSTAKAQRLQVRTFEPSSTITTILVVIVETNGRYWEGYSSRRLERVISTAASVASYASERQYSIGLFSNGTPVLADRPMKIAASSSQEQLTVVLEALATIRPLPMGPMAGQLADNARKFPIGATLVIVAAFVAEEMVDVVQTLKNNGYKIIMLYVGDDECRQMPVGVTIHNLGEHLARLEREREFVPG